MSTTLSIFNDLPFAGVKIEAKPTGTHVWGLWFGDIILADAMTQDEATYFAAIHNLRVEAKPLESLAGILDMPVDHVREAASQIKKERLMDKVRLIRSGNTAILPTGEIVERGTPGAMNYESMNKDNQ